MKSFKNYKLIDLYFDWSNNFLTVARFAECYNMTEDQARSVIARGRIEHNILLAQKPDHLFSIIDLKGFKVSERTKQRYRDRLLSECSA